jgi:putative membrane protein
MLAGLLIGMGMILPGVSGGVLAVILNVYEKTIYSINNFSSNKKENIKFLLPLFIGMLAGCVISAKILKYAFEMYYTESCYIFMGLILGCIPFLIKDVKKKDKKGVNYIVLLITFILSLTATILTKNNLDFSAQVDNGIMSIFRLFLTGFLFISGKVVPGISSSFMLITIGMYPYFLNLLSNPIAIFESSSKIIELIPIIIGALVGAVFFIKLMAILLKKHYAITYSVIIGFVLGSIITMYPNEITIIGIALFILGFVLSYLLSKINKD